MAAMIPFRLGKDYTIRFDALVKRLGLKRPFLVRNLLSLDPIIIDDIEAKAKTLRVIDIYDIAMENDKKNEKVPDVITIRLDEERERRFDALVKSLGAGTKVQVLRNLLCGDPGTIELICMKAKSIPLAPLKEKVAAHTVNSKVNEEVKFVEPTDAIEELIRRKISEFERELRAIFAEQRNALVDAEEILNLEIGYLTESSITSQQPTESQAQVSLFTELHDESEQTPKKRGRSKRVSSGIDRSDSRRQIIEHLNQMTGKNFGSDSEEAKNAIDKMLDKGRAIDQFIKIIDNMTPLWIESPEMNVRLCPETLFREIHWEKYLNANPNPAKAPKGSGKLPVPPELKGKYDDLYL
ncbi:conserved phage C-terminal domain-containing protein [Desulfosporosinus lacus]|uniref:Phage conserved hypothetical protein C-terminal domain-containing protein n=1 Tax=Desulfosporosinus lacus DSM 15449 TaxID=1121420 RepID=A0A1M5QF14_9FIRM|nr:conserved phage C-terminal domain-containing protein [Desulfosporosinus lacus]SHH12622.1 phage conserved hypothetical protein, C-terminal domain-containing protein [Desulfosporosinus lacus DSM 15449]